MSTMHVVDVVWLIISLALSICMHSTDTGRLFVFQDRAYMKKCISNSKKFFDSVEDILRANAESTNTSFSLIHVKTTVEIMCVYASLLFEPYNTPFSHFVYIVAVFMSIRDFPAGGNAHYFLHDERFDGADLILSVALERSVFLGLADITWRDDQHPHTQKYYGRVSARRSFQEACVKGYDIGATRRAIVWWTLKPILKKAGVALVVGAMTLLAWRFVYTYNN